MATNLTDSNNCIQSGLRADIMRCSMENKNLLAKKGSIYVGTGESFKVGEQTIYKTKALELGNNGEILQGGENGLCYGHLKPDHFDSNTIYSSLVPTFNAFSINKDAVKGEFPTLRLYSENFSEDVVYSNLIRVRNNNYSEECGWGGKIELLTDDSGYLQLKSITKTNIAIRYTVKIEGMGNSTVGISDLTAYFNFIGNLGTTSVYGALREYIHRYGEFSSGSVSSLNWSGWVRPTFCTGTDDFKQYNYPFFLQCKDDEETHSMSLSIWRFEIGDNNKVTYKKITLDTSVQYF